MRTINKNLIIIGASGHGKVVAEVAERTNCYENIFFIDDYKKSEKFYSHKILGDSKIISKFKDKADFFVAIGNNEIRKLKYNYLSTEGYEIATLIDPNTIISNSVTIGIGSILMPGSIVNADAVIGKGSIINTKVSIDHDCIVGNYNHLSPGTTLSGTVITGDNVWLGAGTTIINNIKICDDVVVGAGSLVIHDILHTGKYVGAPIRYLKSK